MTTTQPHPHPMPPDRPLASRPGLIDYLLIWLGVGVSALFARMTGLRMVLPEGDPGPAWQALCEVLPALLLLPVGVILFWPIFYTTQWLCGRRSGLTAGEWLLGLAWLGALAFAGWAVGKGTDALSGFLVEDAFKRHAVLGYILFMLSMGALAVLIWLVGLIGRWQQPWTHTLSLALMLWPAAPLLVVWLGNIKME
ncbi:MAG: hypothetical protein L0Y71_06685 [Gemmataceae bacterium]|nr:hypothetical protein [Gemmataceae bacterium]